MDHIKDEDRKNGGAAEFIQEMLPDLACEAAPGRRYWLPWSDQEDSRIVVSGDGPIPGFFWMKDGQWMYIGQLGMERLANACMEVASDPWNEEALRNKASTFASMLDPAAAASRRPRMLKLPPILPPEDEGH